MRLLVVAVWLARWYGSYAISLIVIITEYRVGKIGRNSALPRLDETRDGAA